VVIGSEIEERRKVIESSEDLSGLLSRLVSRAQPVIDRMPVVPRVKALLSTDGGVCPRDGTALTFDPWSPNAHRCHHCGNTYEGERHHRHWARFQHLWLSERAAHLATVGVFTGDDRSLVRASQILSAYDDLYFELPNQDNVLGPTHLFFSTYLESLWLLNVLAAATLLREAGKMEPDQVDGIDRIADEAANVIGEFNEGFSNRQTWHAAALTAVASWFGDEELARTSIEGRTGLLGHLADGFGDDGTWYEGENYHLFALRGLLTGLTWARSLGAELLEDPEVSAHMKAALLAPAMTALPDLTFPARKDSRFGVSLGQPMYLEEWEVGRGLLAHDDPEIAGWLHALYQLPAQPAMTFDSYLHEAGEAPPSRRTRMDLSWWSLLAMPPSLTQGTPWKPASRYFRSQGLAVLRRDDRYVSLECGGHGGGHGHPDRLHLTVHAQGVHWLPDFGTGSYVSRDLFWYRSTLGHNAPMLDGADQPGDNATCEMFDAGSEWSWAKGRYQSFDRTLVMGPSYLLDIVTFADAHPHQVDLPWHFTGKIEVVSPGHWESAPRAMSNEFVHDAERFIPDAAGPFVVDVTVGEKTCRAHLITDGELIRASALSTPGSGESQFLVTRGTGNLVRVVTALDLSGEQAVSAVIMTGDVIEVTHTGVDRHTPLLEGWQIESGDKVIKLLGPVRQQKQAEPIITRERVERQEAIAVWADPAPALDGTPRGFILSDPSTIDTELQYRRSEEPYTSPEEFSATVYLNWSEDELFVMVDVVKQDLVFRPPDAPPLKLDNEVDDIHSDGLQLYLARDGALLGFLIVPVESSDELRISAAGGAGSDPSMVRGKWRRTNAGYRVTLGIRAGWPLSEKDTLECDLIVNEMRRGRERRAGQLVWSGGAGWVYLRGDRQDPASFGLLRLV
jgi:Heparinase II/III-like protein